MDIDKELDSNWEWALDKIQQHKEEVKKKLAAGEKVSSKDGLKNIGRFGNELAYNPWGNAELLEQWRADDADGGRILRDLFNTEDNYLKKPNYTYKLSEGDTVHHWLAQRTGGDTVQNLAHPQKHRFHEALADSPYILGNRGKRNLISFMRGFHLDGDVLKGTEAAALNPLGAFQAKDLNTPKAHRIPASSRLISGTKDLQDGVDAFEWLKPQMATQHQHSQEAFDVMRPIQQRINALVGLPGVDEGSSALERKELRQAISDNAPAVESLIRKEMGPNVLQFTRDEITKKNISPIMKSYQPTALGGFVHGERGPTKTAPQATYTPPKQEGYVHRNKGPQETPPVGGEELTIPGFLTPDNVIKGGQATVAGAAALILNSARAAALVGGSYLLK